MLNQQTIRKLVTQLGEAPIKAGNLLVALKQQELELRHHMDTCMSKASPATTEGSEPVLIQARMVLTEPRKVKQCWEDNVYSIQHEDFDYTTVYPAESTASHNITGDGTFSTCVQMPDGTSVEHTTTAPMEGFAIREPTT